MIKKFDVEKTKQLNKINFLLALFYRKPRYNKKIPLNKVKNIIVIDFALIGDMVMDIPFLRSIKENCPQAKITMVCMPWAEIILGDQKLIDEFIVFNGKDILSNVKNIVKNIFAIKKILNHVNLKHYEIGFEPKGDLRHILFLHYTNCDRTVTYNYTGGDYLVTDSFTPKKETKHLIDEKLDLLEKAGFLLNRDSSVPILKVSDKWKNYVLDFIKRNHLDSFIFIGIHPGASNTNKQYKYFPGVVKRIALSIEDNYKFIIFEGNGEKSIVDSVCSVLPVTRYIRVTKKLKEYISLVSMCDYMICNDSAAGHIAAAYGITTVVIFGPVMPETALPRSSGKVCYISHNLECKPCTLPFCPLGTEKCISDISIDEVYQKVMEIVENRK